MIKKQNKLYRKEKRGVAISEIVLLILGVIALPYILGNSFGEGNSVFPLVSAQEEDSVFKTHNIKSGETLGGIASRYGTSVDVLAYLNNIENVDIIGTGDTLRVPANDEAASASQNLVDSAIERGRGVGEMVISQEIINRIRRSDNQEEEIGRILKGDDAQKGVDRATTGTIPKSVKSGLGDNIGEEVRVMVDGEEVVGTAVEKEGVMGVETEDGEFISGDRISGMAPGWLSKRYEQFVRPESFGQGVAAAGFAMGAAAAIQFAVTFAQTGDPSLAATRAARTGVGAGIGYGIVQGGALLIGTGPAGWVVGLGIAGGVLLSKTFQRQQDRQIIFECKPWQAQSGGEQDCEKCNEGLFPCTEYQCRSLGAACEIENKNTDQQKCVWRDDKDVNPPEIIEPLEDVLFEGYKYEPLPAMRGVEIKYRDEECLPAFQPFAWGVELDREGYCRFEFHRTEEFSEMSFDIGGRNLYLKEHSHIMSFPGVVHIQDYIDRLELEGEEAVGEISNDGEYEIYVRCESVNGRSNREEFLFKFCMDEEEDITPPEIRGFNWDDGEAIGYFAEDEEREVNIEVYTNEPAQCKWDWEDNIPYEEMENELNCPNDPGIINAQRSYACSDQLTGLENNAENTFYFRCNDTFGNVNQESKELTLKGTQPLVIDSVSPNQTTIRGGTSPIKVTIEAETHFGANRGEATCFWSRTSRSQDYVIFRNTETHEHSIDHRLVEGDYDYFIRCHDSAGNADTKQISFTVETDTAAPVIVRAFQRNGNLNIITNEDAECVFNGNDPELGCGYPFEEGIKMNPSKGDKVHSTNWEANRNFYIKCADEFGNQPDPNQCSMIIRPFDVS